MELSSSSPKSGRGNLEGSGEFKKALEAKWWDGTGEVEFG